MFTDLFGAAPPFFALVIALLFYGFAAVRGLRGAPVSFAAGIAGFAIIGPATLNPSTFTPWTFLPVAAAGGVFLVISILRRDSRPAVLAAACFILTLSNEVPRFHEHLLFAPFYLSLVAALVIGAVFQDPFSRMVRNVGAGFLVVMALLLASGDPAFIGELPRNVTLSGPLLLAIVAFAYRRIVRNKLYKIAAISSITIWVVVNGADVYDRLRELIPGLDLLAAGLLFFVVAAVISLFKAGLIPKLKHLRKAGTG